MGESSNDAPETSKLKNNKTVESSEPADDLVKSEAKSKQVKKKLKNKTTNTKLDKLTKQNCTEVLKKLKSSSGKQKVEEDIEKIIPQKEEKTDTQANNAADKVADSSKNITNKAENLSPEKIIKKNTKKINKTGVKRRTRLAPNTRSINTAGVGGSVTKKVKKVKTAAPKEKNSNSDTEEEGETSSRSGEPKSKKIKLGSKDELSKKTAVSSKLEKRKLHDKEIVKDDEPTIKHLKVDDDISFDISSLSPKVLKKKAITKGKAENKTKVSKKNIARVKTKGSLEKAKKKIRKDKSRRTRMSGSNTRSTNIQL